MSRYIEFRRVAIVTALFLVTIVLPFAARAQMKARFNWTSPASNLSGSWVAYEEGFFKKNGLEVEMLHIPSTSRVVHHEVGLFSVLKHQSQIVKQRGLIGFDGEVVVGVAFFDKCSASLRWVSSASAVMSLSLRSRLSSSGMAIPISLVCLSSWVSPLGGRQPTFFGCSRSWCDGRPRS